MLEPYTIPLEDHRPCLVKYVEEWSCFLVGTYRLIESFDEAGAEWTESSMTKVAFMCYARMNYRVGSLLLFSKEEGSDRYKIKQKIKSPNGGVFDFNIRGNKVFVAHSNNNLGEFTYMADGSKKSILPTDSFELTEDTSIILTSIDTCLIRVPSQSQPELCTVVGDSQGRISIMRSSGSRSFDTVKDKVYFSTGSTIVWQVRFVQPPESGATPAKIFLIAGTECHAFHVVCYDTITNRLQIMQRFEREFQAGVTSICIMPCKDETHGDSKEIDVIMGSYDESIKRFSLVIDPLGREVGVQVKTKAKVKAKITDQVVVEGGGIWRLSLVKDDLYIAAMYAGCHKASPKNLKSTLESLTKGLPRKGSASNGEDAPLLDYGIDICQSDGTACVADYNSKSCLFFKP